MLAAEPCKSSNQKVWCMGTAWEVTGKPMALVVRVSVPPGRWREPEGVSKVSEDRGKVFELQGFILEQRV